MPASLPPPAMLRSGMADRGRLGLPPTNLLALEMAGKLRKQLRSFLEAADIADLKQLEGRSRFEVLLIPGVSTKSLATIESLLRDAGLLPLSD